MTTIAYRDGIIAYDSRCTTGSTIVDHNYNKKIVIASVTFICCGTVADLEKACIAFFDDEAEDLPDMDVAYLAWDGITLYSCSVSKGRLYKVPESRKNYFAIGSGEDHALTAMDCGLSAKEAVKKAAYRDVNTGGRIRTFKL